MLSNKEILNIKHEVDYLERTAYSMLFDSKMLNNQLDEYINDLANIKMNDRELSERTCWLLELADRLEDKYE